LVLALCADSGAALPEPKTDLDLIFAAYGTACYGMDWRILKGIAKAESNLNANSVNEDYPKYKGLFQESAEFCEDNIGPFSSFLDCGDRLDPEVNTAAAAAKIDADMKKIIKACPGIPLKDLIVLVYVGHNNGDAALDFVLGERSLKDVAPVCRFGKPMTRTLARWYDTGHKRRRNTVDAETGVRKLGYGMRVAKSVLKAGAESAYPPDAKAEAPCPRLTRRRALAK
jgi:hypothetical protein